VNVLKLRTDNLLVLGLSDENLTRLRAGEPILFPGEDVGLPGLRIAIMWGETERAMEQDLLAIGIRIPQ
jgi:hypothetical protein